jgi:hypothetical protein
MKDLIIRIGKPVDDLSLNTIAGRDDVPDIMIEKLLESLRT